MEDIFTNTKKTEKISLIIRISKETANKLKSLNKGSYNNAINELLSLNYDKKNENRIKTLEEDVFKIEEIIQRVINLNKLKA
jgi:hypothetical protein